MKIIKFLVFLSLLLLSQISNAQDLLGDWLIYTTTTNGKNLTNRFSLAENGIIHIDYENNKEIEVVTTYRLEDNRLLIENTAKGSPCEGLVSIYEFQLESTISRIKVIKMPCSLGKQEGKIWQIERLNTPLLAEKT